MRYNYNQMIGENIKQKAKEKRITIAELSRKAKVPAPTLYTYTNNTRMPSAGNLKKIADALNATTDELLKEPEPVYPATAELRRNPTAGFVFNKDDFYDRLNPEGKKMLEAILQTLKQQYKK
jgi:transcriptional regulator with XRE-family HTH domain